MEWFMDSVATQFYEKENIDSYTYSNMEVCVRRASL